jgi:hypothetical protein
VTTTTERGRRRQQALFDFLGQYAAATTDQLAALIWGGNERLARQHLLAYTRAGQLRRLPHPVYRNGAYVYTRRQSATSHTQKVLHHLSEVDFYLAVVSHLARYGARTVAEMDWGPGVVPDQTVIWRDAVWAVEHHLSGQFGHASDYQRFMEEEAYTLCHWWRDGLRLGLLVITGGAGAGDHVRAQLRRYSPSGLTWRVGTREEILRDPGPWLRLR